MIPKLSNLGMGYGTSVGVGNQSGVPSVSGVTPRSISSPAPPPPAPPKVPSGQSSGPSLGSASSSLPKMSAPVQMNPVLAAAQYNQLPTGGTAMRELVLMADEERAARIKRYRDIAEANARAEIATQVMNAENARIMMAAREGALNARLQHEGQIASVDPGTLPDGILETLGVGSGDVEEHEQMKMSAVHQLFTKVSQEYGFDEEGDVSEESDGLVERLKGLKIPSLTEGQKVPLAVIGGSLAALLGAKTGAKLLEREAFKRFSRRSDLDRALFGNVGGFSTQVPTIGTWTTRPGLLSRRPTTGVIDKLRGLHLFTARNMAIGRNQEDALTRAITGSLVGAAGAGLPVNALLRGREKESSLLLLGTLGGAGGGLVAATRAMGKPYRKRPNLDKLLFGRGAKERGLSPIFPAFAHKPGLLSSRFKPGKLRKFRNFFGDDAHLAARDTASDAVNRAMTGILGGAAIGATPALLAETLRRGREDQ